MPTRSIPPQPTVGGRIHAYARVSTPDQAEADRTSLDEQVGIIRDRVKCYRADAPIVVWREEGFTAATPLAERPVGKEMLANLRSGDTVVSTRADRLFRHMTSASAQIEAWQRQEIKVMLIDLPIQPGMDWDAAATCCFHILMAFAQFERQRMRERTLGAKRALQERGLYAGGRPPFGKAIEHIGPRQRRLVDNPVEQAAIRRARLLWDQGRAMKDILRILFAEGHRNRAGGPIWDQSVRKWVERAGTESVSERTRAALARRKARGERLGNPDVAKVAPLGILAIAKQTRERAERILPYIDYFISEGYNSYRQLADILNANNVPAARGDRWYPSSVRNVMLAAGRRWVSAPNGNGGGGEPVRLATVLPFPDLRRPDRAERNRISQTYNLAATVRRRSKAAKLWPEILAYYERGVPHDRIGHIVGVHPHTVEAVLARFATDRASAPVPDRIANEPFGGATVNAKEVELRRTIIDLRRQGLSCRAIAVELKVSINKVHTVIGAAKGRDPTLAFQRGRASDSEIARIFSLRLQQKSVAVISREVGVPAHTVRRIIRALIPDHPDLALRKGMSPAELEDIRALLDRSVPLTEIGERFGRSPRSIERALARAARATRDAL
jgi:DNA invertase Pin-like site-specific DNA recombinase/transposase